MPKERSRSARRGRAQRTPQTTAPERSAAREEPAESAPASPEATAESAPAAPEEPAESAPPEKPAARRILDRYRLDEQIAVGGMAEVWRAEDETLGRPVAVKLLHQHLLPDQASRRRFEVEARAAASLSHPGIVNVYDVSVTPDEAAIVMEFVPGRGLNRVLAERGRLPEEDAVEIAAQVAEALDHAHRRGVIHRDLKPDNILVDGDDHARLVDFGIARVASDTAQRLTIAGTTLGTLRYMAPEQLAGEPGDERTDVFGLGATLYQMLAGRSPFDADAPALLMRQQRARPPAIPGVAAGVMNVVWDALDPEPVHRPQSAGELARRLRLLDGQEPALPEAEAPIYPDAATSTRVWREPARSAMPVPIPAAAAPAAPAWRNEPAAPVWREQPARSTRGPGFGWRALRGLPLGPLALLLVALLIIGVVIGSARLGQVAGGGAGNAPPRTFRAVADARVALRGNFQAGAGADNALPVGQHDDVLYRSLIRFSPDWDGVRRVVRIQLRLQTTGEVRVNRGGSPSTIVRRNMSGSWSEGDSKDLTGRNSVTWASKPRTTTDGEVRFDGPVPENDTITVDVTRLYLPMAPRSVGGQGAPNLGITLLAASDDGSEAMPSDTNEFWSSEVGDRGPRLIVTYER